MNGAKDPLLAAIVGVSARVNGDFNSWVTGEEKSGPPSFPEKFSHFAKNGGITACFLDQINRKGGDNTTTN